MRGNAKGHRSWSHVSLDGGVSEEYEGVDDNRRREASLMISAMSVLAITGMCTVTCSRGSWGRSGWDIYGE